MMLHIETPKMSTTFIFNTYVLSDLGLESLQGVNSLGDRLEIISKVLIAQLRSKHDKLNSEGTMNIPISKIISNEYVLSQTSHQLLSLKNNVNDAHRINMSYISWYHSKVSPPNVCILLCYSTEEHFGFGEHIGIKLRVQ